MFNCNMMIWKQSSISLAVTLNVAVCFAAYSLGEFGFDIVEHLFQNHWLRTCHLAQTEPCLQTSLEHPPVFSVTQQSHDIDILHDLHSLIPSYRKLQRQKPTQLRPFFSSSSLRQSDSFERSTLCLSPLMIKKRGLICHSGGLFIQ